MVAIRQSAASATLPGAPLADSLLVALAVPDSSGGVTDPPFGTVGTLEAYIAAPLDGGNSEVIYGDDGTGPGTLYLWNEAVYRFDITVVHDHASPATNSNYIKVTMEGGDIGVLNFGAVRDGTAITFMSRTGGSNVTNPPGYQKLKATLKHTAYVHCNGVGSSVVCVVTYVSGPDPRYEAGPPGSALVWPDGWAAQGNDTDVNGEALEVRTKVSEGAGDTTIDFSGGTAPVKVAYYELTDWDSVSGAAVAAYENDGTPSLPSITPVAGRPAILIGGVSKHPDAGPQTVSGYSSGPGGTFGTDGRLTTWSRIIAETSGAYTATASDSGDATDDGVAAHLAVVGPEPEPPSKFQYCVSTQDGTPLVCFTGLTEKTIRIEFNGTGSGNFTIYRGHPQATEANLARGNIVSVTIPEIHSGVLFEFIIEDGDFELISSDEQGGELLQFGGRGTLALLENARLAWNNLTAGPSVEYPDEGVWRWTEEEAATIILRMIAEAQAHTPPAIAGVTTDFSGTTDSLGNPFFDLDGIWEVEIGTDLLTAAMDLADKGMIQFEMRPGQVLKAYDEQGTDRSSTTFATDKVRFVKGVNISSELSRQMSGRAFGSTVLIHTRYGYAWQTGGGSPPYIRELFLDLTNMSGYSAAFRAAANKLLKAADEQDGLILEVPPYGRDAGPNDESAGWYYPGWEGTDHGKFWVGDYVTLHTGTDDFDYDNETFRVQAISLTIDEAGELAPAIVELQVPWETEPERTGTSVSSGGSGDSSSSGTVPAHVHTQYQVAGTAKWKEPVRVATTANLTISTGLNAGDTVDGVTLADGDRVLVKDQSAATQNGIYVAGATPARATDFDGAAEIAGSAVRVMEGTANADKVFLNTNDAPPGIGADDITFAALSASASVSYATTSDIADVAATESAGAATTVPRGDHVHALGIVTTRGDIIRRGSSGPERLALGANGTVLSSDGTDAVWASPAGVTYAGTSDLADVAATESAGAATTVPRGDHVHRLGITTTRGDLIRRGASDNERVALGATGKILTSDGTDAVWGNGPLTTRGDMITAGASGAIQRLALGAAGRRVGSDGTDAVWLEDFRIIQAWLDGGGVTLTTGLKLWTSPLPWDAVPVAWYLDGDADGAAVVDIGKGTTWAGSALSSMCASDKPTITATGGTDLTATGSCTGWGTITAGDRLTVNLDSVTSFKKLMVGIKLRLTS